jgi:hypothetical protein
VQSPGAGAVAEPSRHAALGDDVEGVLDRFRSDSRFDG